MFRKAYTFDDLLLVPQYSEVLPKDVDVKTHLTRELTINIPILSAAMDTVTESDMAITMAREGGIGIIHKNMSVSKQAMEVKRVKVTENGVIKDPVTIRPDESVEDAEKLMSFYKIGGLPVVENRKLVGILTNRDIRFQEERSMKVKEMMTPFEKLVVAYPPVTLDDAKKILQAHKIEKLPIIEKDGSLVGLITIKDIRSVYEHPNAARDLRGRLLVGAAVGVTDTIERVKALADADVDVIVLDTAHGDSKRVVDAIVKVKTAYPNLQLIAGNVATAQGVRDLANAGVDGIKVGIGPGSICTTRIVSGIGIPQITAVMDCSEESSKYGIPVIADGGIRYSGDIVKAIAAGAYTVMIGNLLAGTDEAPGETIIYEGRKFKTYRGMGSMGAMKLGSGDRYAQENYTVDKLVPEGIEGMVPYRGKTAEILYQLIGGLRSGMGYCGANDIEVLHEKAQFIEISQSGMNESHPHDIFITKEAPNYESRR
ncbi:MAG: IMP dehydrogenase [Athalassotoga sp.]|uniref:IMP dehydrogenase n=1 Tax=Athalassotoga sp. TaxID=2022597 RepID=UPI003CFE9CD7